MKKIIALLPVFLLFLISVYAQDPEIDLRPKEEGYESCCGATPVEFRTLKDDDYIFVPNVFTPNKDKVNDKFFPFVGKSIGEISYFEIYFETKDSSEQLLYRVRDVKLKHTLDDVEDYGWDGLDLDGKPHIGAFHYNLYVYSKNAGFEVKGRGCSVNCEDKDAEIFKKMKDCFLPEQFGESGELDKGKEVRDGCF